MIPLRYMLTLIAAALFAHRRQRQELRRLEALGRELGEFYGKRYQEGDAREERMIKLAARQFHLGWLTLLVALASLTIAVVALAQ